MNRMMMAVAGAAMAVVLAGCSGSVIGDSPSSVAEDFARAIIEKKTADALDLCDLKFFRMRDNDDSYPYSRYRSGPTLKSKSDVKKIKSDFEDMAKEIDDDKLDVVAIMEVVETPGENAGSAHVDGKKYTGERAEVTVQCVRGRDKKKKGLRVSLIMVDGSWKVVGCSLVSDLDDLYQGD